MYVRTPKKYRGIQRRNIIPFRRILFWLFALFLITVGIGIYQLRDSIVPQINAFVEENVNRMQVAVSTMTAPTPTPTPDPRNDLIQADNYWTQGSITEAVRLYKGVIHAVPNDVTVHYRLTLGLITMGQTDEALEYAERTVTANPFSADAWAIRSWALDWEGRYGEAIASALHALELDPDNARATAFLAEAYRDAGQDQRALTLIEKALALDPNSFEAYRARGLIYWQNQFQLDLAMEDFQEAYSIAPNMSYIAIDMSVIEQARGNIDEAIDLLESVIEVNPENTLALFWLGNIYLRNIGDPSQSAGYLTRCIDYNPESINCHYLLGRAQVRLEQYQQASESFAKAVELGSSDPYHWWWAGSSQIDIGNCSKAMSFLEPGYEIALQGTDTEIINAYEAIMPECRGFGAPSGGAPAPTPTALPDTGGDL